MPMLPVVSEGSMRWIELDAGRSKKFASGRGTGRILVHRTLVILQPVMQGTDTAHVVDSRFTFDDNGLSGENSK